MFTIFYFCFNVIYSFFSLFYIRPFVIWFFLEIFEISTYSSWKISENTKSKERNMMMCMRCECDRTSYMTEKKTWCGRTFNILPIPYSRIRKNIFILLLQQNFSNRLIRKENWQCHSIPRKKKGINGQRFLQHIFCWWIVMIFDIDLSTIFFFKKKSIRLNLIVPLNACEKNE